MDVIAAYRDLGSYRGAAAICGTTPKTVKRIVEAHETGTVPERAARGHNYDDGGRARRRTHRSDQGTDLRPSGCCPPLERRAIRDPPGTCGDSSPRRRSPGGPNITGSFVQRSGHRATCSPSTGAPKDDLHVFCAVLAWSRVRFIAFADNERQDTTLALLAQCFEAIGGVPQVVLADRMGCLKGGVVANVVVPAPGYVAFAAALWVPAGLLRSGRSAVERDRREPRRLCEVRSHRRR